MDSTRPRGRHATDPYRGEVAYPDAQAARPLRGLRAARLLDSALAVLAADRGQALHGYPLCDSTARSPLGLQAGDLQAGEESGVEVPKGLRVATPVLLSDPVSALTDRLELSPIPGNGVCLTPLLRGQRVPVRELAPWNDRLGGTERRPANPARPLCLSRVPQ